MDAADYAISIQVLHEFYDRVSRPAKTRQLSDQEIGSFLSIWRTFRVAPLTLELFDRAVAIRRRYRFRYYDSSIIAAALDTNCDMLLSEDLKADQQIEGLRVVNPFPEGITSPSAAPPA
jgi:predicted nucleic acid-binding protein